MDFLTNIKSPPRPRYVKWSFTTMTSDEKEAEKFVQPMMRAETLEKTTTEKMLMELESHYASERHQLEEEEEPHPYVTLEGFEFLPPFSATRTAYISALHAQLATLYARLDAFQKREKLEPFKGQSLSIFSDVDEWRWEAVNLEPEIYYVEQDLQRIKEMSDLHYAQLAPVWKQVRSRHEQS